jgi:hypothetical protein
MASSKESKKEERISPIAMRSLSTFKNYPEKKG